MFSSSGPSFTCWLLVRILRFSIVVGLAQSRILSPLSSPLSSISLSPLCSLLLFALSFETCLYVLSSYSFTHRRDHTEGISLLLPTASKVTNPARSTLQSSLGRRSIHLDDPEDEVIPNLALTDARYASASSCWCTLSDFSLFSTFSPLSLLSLPPSFFVFHMALCRSYSEESSAVSWSFVGVTRIIVN